MSDKSISVIIPVHNRLDHTKKCIVNLSEQRLDSDIPEKQMHVIVVDDGSSDKTSDWIMANYPSVHLLHGDGNLWWSGGINKGVRYALDELKSDYILWWNNDILAARDYFSELFKIIENVPDDVIIGSKIFRLYADFIFGMGGVFDPRNGNYGMYGYNQEDGPKYQEPFEVDWFPGMGTVMHNSVFRKIGFVDEINFPQYHGDSDFTYRAKKAGLKLVAYPRIVIFNDTHKRKEFKNLYESLTNIRSLYCLKKDLLFYKRHSTSIKAYLFLLRKYLMFFGGKIKWMVLGMFGVKRNT